MIEFKNLLFVDNGIIRKVGNNGNIPISKLLFHDNGIMRQVGNAPPSSFSIDKLLCQKEDSIIYQISAT